MFIENNVCELAPLGYYNFCFISPKKKKKKNVEQERQAGQQLGIFVYYAKEEYKIYIYKYIHKEINTGTRVMYMRITDKITNMLLHFIAFVVSTGSYED